MGNDSPAGAAFSDARLAEDSSGAEARTDAVIGDLMHDGRSSLPQFDLNTCKFVPVTNDNIDVFHSLINSQAEAHNTIVRGDRAETVKALLHENPEKRILDGFILQTEQGYPAGFVTTSYSHTSEGSVMYLEDIHTLPEFQIGPDGRGRRVGSTMYRAVQAVAWANGCHAVPCTVDDGNESAKTFYGRMGADKHEFPVLGMDGFTTLNSSKELGSAIVISAEDRAKPEIAALIDDSTNTINIAEGEIAAMDLQAVQLHDVALDDSNIRIINGDDIEALNAIRDLEEQLDETGQTPWVGSHHVEKKAFISALKDVVKHPRNFCVASFNAAGDMESVSFVKVSFSTFGNAQRLNFGSTVSLTGDIPDQDTVMNHLAFCQNLELGGDRLEVQLDPKVASNSEMQKLFSICSSQMTPENPTDEYTWSVKVRPQILADWVRGLSPSLQTSLIDMAGRDKMSRALSYVPPTAGADMKKNR